MLVGSLPTGGNRGCFVVGGAFTKVVAEVMCTMNWRIELEFLRLCCLIVPTALLKSLRVGTTVLVLQCSLRVYPQQLRALLLMSCSLLDVNSCNSGFRPMCLALTKSVFLAAHP